MVFQHSNLIAESIDKIKSLFPEATNIYYRNVPDKKGLYHCHIELRCFGKRLFVMKDGGTYASSLMKAEQTMLRMLKKEKEKNLKPKDRLTNQFVSLDHSTSFPVAS